MCRYLFMTNIFKNTRALLIGELGLQGEFIGDNEAQIFILYYSLFYRYQVDQLYAITGERERKF